MNAFSKNASAQPPKLLMSLQHVDTCSAIRLVSLSAEDQQGDTMLLLCQAPTVSQMGSRHSLGRRGAARRPMLSLAGTAQGHSLPLMTSKRIAHNALCALECRVTYGSQGHQCTLRCSRGATSRAARHAGLRLRLPTQRTHLGGRTVHLLRTLAVLYIQDHARAGKKNAIAGDVMAPMTELMTCTQCKAFSVTGARQQYARQVRCTVQVHVADTRGRQCINTI